MNAPPTATRWEHDLLGQRAVPAHVYWGIHTLRATENFRIRGETIGEVTDLVRALALIKKAAALTNADLGLLEPQIASAVAAACDRITAGEFHDQFPISMIQGGAGTSTNMNANEVIANVALEHLGLAPGTYARIHPNEHVNMGQSTNDVYPTALKLATIKATHTLLASLQHLRDSFQLKAREFEHLVKIGRTQLQDAVPMTLGQEFGAYEVMVREDIARLREALVHLHEINLGATAIGTGLNTHPEYARRVRFHLVELTGLPLTTAPNLVEATQDCGSFVLLSGTLKRTAIKISKICNDLRLLSSGPRAGLGEITLPPRQAGSSIMPGKVNPVIPEMVNQVAFEVVGNDTTVTMAAEAGQLQLNAFEPIIAYALLRSIAHLTTAAQSLADHCVTGISANEQRLKDLVGNSIATVTALNPVIGYTAATEVASEALSTGRPVAQVVLERGLLGKDAIDRLLQPTAIARPAHVREQ